MTLSRYFSKADHLARTHAQDADDALHDNLQELIDSAEAFLRSTASYSGTEIEAARARVMSQLDAARKHVRHRAPSRVYRRATEAARTSGHYIREHKWQSVSLLAIAAALAGGIYAGLKWTEHGHRRRRRSIW